MVRIPLIFIFMVAFLPLSQGQEKETLPYAEGERLFFDLSYGWIKGGEGEMQYLTVERDTGRMGVVHAEAHTTGIFSWFSPVEDRSETFFRLRDGYPVRSAREILRRGKNSSEELLFLDDNHRVHSSRSGDHLYQVRMFDVLSAFYQARRMLYREPPKEGCVLRLPLFFDGKFFDIRVVYDGQEVIRTFLGRRNCYRFVPDTVQNNTFTDPEQLRIWVTDDGHYLPVKIVVRLPVGSFRCVMTGME
jgi:hypothetical protein